MATRCDVSVGRGDTWGDCGGPLVGRTRRATWTKTEYCRLMSDYIIHEVLLSIRFVNQIILGCFDVVFLICIQ